MSAIGRSAGLAPLVSSVAIDMKSWRWKIEVRHRSTRPIEPISAPAPHVVTVCGGSKPAYILLMSGALVVAVSLPIIVVITLFIAAVFVSARLNRREPGPASTRRCRHWRGRVQKEEAIVLNRMSRPPGENLAYRSGVRCDGRSGVVGVHEQRGYERTHDSDGDSNCARGAKEFVVEDVAEKTVTELPAGPLYWHVENFPALADAEAAAGPLSLAADVEGKVWLFTLGPKGTPMHGGSMVSEIGPLVDVSAPEYLLAISHGVAAPGAKSGVHTHPAPRRSWCWRVS